MKLNGCHHAVRGNVDRDHEVLKQIGADEVPCLLVYNKVDRLQDNFVEQGKVRVDRDEQGKATRIWLSAQQKLGLDQLMELVSEHLEQDMFNDVLCIKPSWGKLRAWCFKQQAVVKEEITEQGESLLEVSLPMKDLHQALKHNHLSLQEVLAH